MNPDDRREFLHRVEQGRQSYRLPRRQKRTAKQPYTIPERLRLPDTIEEIEKGRE